MSARVPYLVEPCAMCGAPAKYYKCGNKRFVPSCEKTRCDKLTDRYLRDPAPDPFLPRLH